MRRYHDEEWGVPVHDDRVLFEFLTLEGASGTFLVDHLEEAGELPRSVRWIRSGEGRALRLEAPGRPSMKNAGIVRTASRSSHDIQRPRLPRDSEGIRELRPLRVGFVGGKPIQSRRKSLRDLPARTAESDALSADLRKRGFRFVGSTIVYAFMQAVGLVNDHEVRCFRHRDLAARS